MGRAALVDRDVATGAASAASAAFTGAGGGAFIAVAVAVVDVDVKAGFVPGDALKHRRGRHRAGIRDLRADFGHDVQVASLFISATVTMMSPFVVPVSTVCPVFMPVTMSPSLHGRTALGRCHALQ